MIPDTPLASSTFCAECGSEIEPKSAFCPECGQRDEPSDEYPQTSAEVDDGSENGSSLRSRVAGKARSVPRRAWIITAGALCASLVVVGGVFWYLNQEDDSARTKSSIRAAASTEVLLRSATPRIHYLTDIRSLAHRVEAQLPDLKEANSTAAGISDASTREPIVQSTRALVAGSLALARMSRLSSNKPQDWQRQVGQIADAASVLRLGWPNLTRVARAAGVTDLPAEEQLSLAVSKAGLVVDKAIRKLARWQAAVHQSLRTKHAELAALTAYSAAMQGQIATYGQQRDDTQSFLNHANDGGYNITFDDAYTFVADAQSARQNVQSSMRAMTPPTDALSAHSGMVDAIGSAVDALNYATSGLQEYQADKGSFSPEYSSFRDTPSWQEFTSLSDSAGANWSSAVSSWEAGIAKARSEISKRKPPKKPKF